jgi:hypothetical protein
MSHTPPNNPRTGVAITGLLLGVIVEQSYDKKYTNYRMGVATESRPDKFGQVVQTTNEIEMTEQQYQRLGNSIQMNVNQPVRVWVELDHRAGEKNGKVWEILNLRMRTDSDIEYLNTNKSAQTPAPVAQHTPLPEGVKVTK